MKPTQAPCLFAAIVCVVVSSVGAQSATSVQDASRTHDAAKSSSNVVSFTDAAIAKPQRDVLVLAFEVACAIPSQPHIKDRCKLQEEAAAACITLNQPRLALEFTERIDDWRKGAAYADLALHCARTGYDAEAEQYLKMAQSIALSADDWRRDIVRARIARTYVWLGQESKAIEAASEIAKSEMGVVVAAQAEKSASSDFDARMTSLVGSLMSNDFDLMRGALDACIVLFGRHFEDADRRSRLEETIRLHVEQMPVPLRIEIYLSLAEIAGTHDDRSRAGEFVRQARSYLSFPGWFAEDKVPYLARVAKGHFLAGESEQAEREINAAIALFMTERDTITWTSRTRALLPVAETYQAMGRPDAALSIYRRALEIAAANPNARPRANDLGAACLSMALNSVSPDDGLWEVLHQMRAGLVDPW